MPADKLNQEAQANAMKLRVALRYTVRVDLLQFANKVLQYPDISREVHGPILDALPKLYGGHEHEYSPGKFSYRPIYEINQLPGPRQFLFLYPRGHLKTSLISQAYLIQWIINYPDIRILLSCATGEQIEKIVRAVKGVFQYSDSFRSLFPEYCPTREKAADFGSKDQFITPARKLNRGEPTLFAVTVGKTIAGYHPDIIFHSDLVDKENVKTPGGLRDVISHFSYMNPLLERYSAKDGYPATRGFVFVEGTVYDYGDLHNLIAKDKAYKDWVKVIKPAQEDYPKGKILWPERFPQEELDKIRLEMGDWHFSSQYLLKCIPEGDGLCDPKDVQFVPAHIISQILPQLRLHVTIDLAGMEQVRGGDFTVLTLGGFDRDGRLYIIEVHCGHYPPEEVIEIIFTLHKSYPQIIDYKIEKEAHARVLLPFLQREMSKRQRYPTMWAIKRDTHTSKQHRIRGLRPWFKTGIIRFSEALPLSTKTELLDEVAQFPSQSSGVHDDILDTLADQMQNQDGGVNADVIADPPDLKFIGFGMQRPRDRFLGFRDGDGVAQWLFGNDEPDAFGVKAPTGIM